jgi:ribosomal protein S18 acetylase RimI-like enzyme
MSATTVAPATPSTVNDPNAAIPTLIVAFASDPIVRWFLPDADRYLQRFPALLRLTAGPAAAGGGVDITGGDAGAALWHAPGTDTPDEDLAAFIAESVDPVRLEHAFGFLEQLGSWHLKQPHWYLPFIGVDPTRQGQGHGSRLLAHGVARCDRDRIPAYLEASSPRNRSLYERHGFEVIAEIQEADSPPMWPMVRPAS